MICFSDLETANEEPISSGSYRYSETVDIQLWAYAFDDGPVTVWDRASGEPMPFSLHTALLDETIKFCWHNQTFDRIQLLNGLGIKLSAERIIDTMVLAYQHGLPGALQDLCTVFNLPEDVAKQKRGKQLVHLFCKPRPKNSKVRWATHETHPKEWAEYKEYAKHDILAMREVYKRIKKWNDTPKEREIWLLDQKINDRGFQVDIELAHAALAAVDEAKAGLAKQVNALTEGVVEAATQRDALLDHILEEYGLTLKDMRAATLEKLLSDPEVPEGVKELLRIRLEASSSSVSKYKKFLACVSSDGRMRGTLQYCGAGRTGRWAGRCVQPQNFPRPKFKQPIIDFGIEALKKGCADLFYPNVTELCASSIRGLITAPKGKKLVISDLSNIEGRMIAWLAGEEWKLKMFADFDAGTGVDNYIAAYAKAFNVPLDKVGDKERQVGKVMELMLGYGGGVGAFVTGAATYRVDLDDLASRARKTVPQEVWFEAENFLEWIKKVKGKRYGLADETFVACDALKRLWRNSNPAIAAFWKALEETFKCAIRKPKKEFECGMLRCYSEGKWAAIIFPSGRYLCYPGAAIRVSENGKEEITYLGVNQYTRKWCRLKTYGGKLSENGSQFESRDILAWSMPRVDAAGYEIVLSVHDELITETPDTEEYTAKGLSKLMTQGEAWSKGLPLAAKGFEAYRYKKD